MSRPVLGISCCNRPFGEETAQVVVDRYVEAALKYADAAALLVPARPDLMSAREVAGRLDGLFLTGSPSNIETWRYGEDGAADAAGPYDPGRDSMVLALIEAMRELGRPIFGVCRGFEEINIAFGGTLRRDAADNPSLLTHHAPEGVNLDGAFAHEHEVDLAPGGVLARAYGREKLTVNSVHHQAIRRLGAGLRAEATAPDGLVEALAADSGPPILAVQWHPEWRASETPQSQTFFKLVGRVLRGEAL